MSTPAPSRLPAALQPTRQQIDDLDALLQRMLSLPVKAPEEDLDEVDERALEEAAAIADNPVEPFAELSVNYPLPEFDVATEVEAVRPAAPEFLQGPSAAALPEPQP